MVDSGDMLIWAAIGTVMVGVIGGLAVWVLNRISKDMSEIKGSLSSLEKDLREGVSKLDRRVTIIETNCVNHHHRGQQ